MYKMLSKVKNYNAIPSKMFPSLPSNFIGCMGRGESKIIRSIFMSTSLVNLSTNE